MAVSGSDINDDFIKACRDGDLTKFNDLVDRADVNYVSESGNQAGSRNFTIKVNSFKIHFTSTIIVMDRFSIGREFPLLEL